MEENTTYSEEDKRAERRGKIISVLIIIGVILIIAIPVIDGIVKERQREQHIIEIMSSGSGPTLDDIANNFSEQADGIADEVNEKNNQLNRGE